VRLSDVEGEMCFSSRTRTALHLIFDFQLSGYDLQKENPTEVEDAINQLKYIAEEQNIQTKRLIQSVVDLFYDNWGRKDGEFVVFFTVNFSMTIEFF
jgi:hypothetical protein